MDTTKFYTKKEFAEKIKKSQKTLERWDKSDILKAHRNIKGNPYYTDAHYEVFLADLDNNQHCRLLKSIVDQDEIKKARIEINPYHGIPFKYKHELDYMRKSSFIQSIFEPMLQKVDILSTIYDLKHHKIDYKEDGGGRFNIMAESGISKKVVDYFKDAIVKTMYLLRDNLDIPLPLLNNSDALNFFIVDGDPDKYVGSNTRVSFGLPANALFDPETWTIYLPVKSNTQISHEIIHALDIYVGLIWYKKPVAMSFMVYHKLFTTEDDRLAKDIYINDLDDVEKLMGNFIFDSKKYRKRLKDKALDLKLNPFWVKYFADPSEAFARVGELVANDDDFLPQQSDIKDSGFSEEDTSSIKMADGSSIIKDHSIYPMMADKVDVLREDLRRWVSSYHSWKLKTNNNSGNI